MATTTATRRLAAILAADVVGYSRLMGADEEGTHERFKAHLIELLDPKIREHHGRIVKTTGDGVLAEFASVVDAVQCAAEIQRAMAERDLDLAEERRLRFRIGINLGDVIADGGDIYGDGVNIAARLEGLAAPGGICVSGTVRDHIGDRLPYAFEDMGAQNVKNIAHPVRVYALRREGLASLSVPIPLARPIRRHRAVIGTAAALVLVIICIAPWFWPAAKPPPTLTAATSVAQPLVAPRLSIVVLPFTNLSNDPDQQYFVDGITDDLTTALSRTPDLFVISRNSAFTYRNRQIDTKQIGRELGVRYVLEGSARRAANKVRVNVQVISAETDSHLWADQFDNDIGDLFTLQSEITSRVATALGAELIMTEAVQPTDNPDALSYILRGRAAMLKPLSRDVYGEAISMYEHALTLDPQSAEAKSLLAIALANRVLNGMTGTPAADTARAADLAAQALVSSPRSTTAHVAKGVVLSTQGRCEEAISEYETVLAINRNAVGVLTLLAVCKLTTGSIEEVIPLEEQAIRLSPLDPRIGHFYREIGFVHLLQSRIDEAILWLEKARSTTQELPWTHHLLASAYGLKGNTERAAAELTEARRLRGGRYASIAQIKAFPSGYRAVAPNIQALLDATYFAGLRKAGMPEQ